MRTTTQRGFSLVELSIVLVILGLLTGGILTGQNLIRAAELRSVVTEFQSYSTAVMTFRDKYFALPGDMTNATDFWGIVAGGPGTCLTVPGTGTQTCDGDGNGEINFSAGGFEFLRVWQHLSNAGLVTGASTQGRYSGALLDNSSTYVGYVAGVNNPRSKLGNGMYMMMHHSANSADDYDGMNFSGQHVFALCEASGTAALACGVGTTGVVDVDEAWNIDTKVDDGLADSGGVMSDTCVGNSTTFNDFDATECAGANCDYDFSSTAKCNVEFFF